MFGNNRVVQIPRITRTMANMEWHMTKPRGYRQEASQQLLCFFVLCLPYYQSLLFAGMSGMISFLLLTLLLIFVVARSPAVAHVITARLKVLPPSWFVPTPNSRSYWTSEPFSAVGAEPSLAPLFQRPPPLFS
jgi:hypothetical protein